MAVPRKAPTPTPAAAPVAAAAPAPQQSAPAPAPMGHNSAPARVPLPTIPGRAVAYNRAGQPIQRAAAEQGVDQFGLPPHLPQPGWSMEWKRDTVYGESDPGYASLLGQVGWEHVMYEQHPGWFAPEFDDKGQPRKGPVRRQGLMLMERPLVLTEEAKRDDKRKADERVGSAKQQYTKIAVGTASAADFLRDAPNATYIRQSVDNNILPGNPNSQPID